MLNDYCNNRCTYCRQFSEYGNTELSVENFFKIYDFFTQSIPQDKRVVLFEWWEPTFYTHLETILKGIHKRKEKIAILSNWRVPEFNRDVIKEWLEKGVIDYIGLHVPVANEPFAAEWEKDAYDFLTYLWPHLKDKIIIIWLMHSGGLTKKELLPLLRYRQKYGDLIMGNSFCFPHPNLMARHYIDYKSRLEIMKHLVKIFLYMMKHNYPLILDSTLPCILKYGLEHNNLLWTKAEKHFMETRIGMVKNFEFHIDVHGETTLLSNIAKTCFLQAGSIYDFTDLGSLQVALNKQIESEYEKYFTNFPKQCTSCDYFLKWCTGDHFKLISTYAST